MIAVNGNGGQTGKAKAGQGKAGEKVTSAALMTLLRQQGFKCALTGRELDPQTASVDHIEPLSTSGKNVMSNIHIVHRDVNFAKGTMTLEDFVLMCRQVVENLQENK